MLVRLEIFTVRLDNGKDLHLVSQELMRMDTIRKALLFLSIAKTNIYQSDKIFGEIMVKITPAESPELYGMPYNTSFFVNWLVAYEILERVIREQELLLAMGKASKIELV